MNIIGLMILVFVTTGCTTKDVIVYRDRVIYVKPNKSILDYNITTPRFDVPKEDYVRASPTDRGDYLTIYITRLLGTIGKYKIKDKKIHEWYESTEK